MAVDTVAIKELYKELNQSIKDSLDIQEAASHLTSKDYATVLTSLIGKNLEISVATVQGQPGIDAQVALEQAKVALANKDLALKDAQIALEVQKKLSMIIDDGIKTAQSDKDLLLKDKQLLEADAKIANLNSDTALKDAEKATIAPQNTAKLASMDAQTALTKTQDSEAVLNGVATRNVKLMDEQVKTDQASLLVRQAKALDDALLKDVLKEASGGYAMVYDATAGKLVPGTWKEMDRITNELLKNSGSTLQVNPIDLTK